MTLGIKTERKRQVIDITDQVSRVTDIQSGWVMVFVAHTTAAVTAADLDPGTDLDLLDALDQLLPDLAWRHPHDPSHTPDHILASVIGPSLVVPLVNGQLQLGSWQRIILVELDGPRERTVHVSVLGA